MFSIMPSGLAESIHERFGSRVSLADAGRPHLDALSVGWPEFDDVLPDRGLPRGIVEVRAPRALGGATSIALAAVRAAHERDERAWCAWIDPDGMLYAPGVAMAGVDLNRLAIVRAPRPAVLRIAVKVVRSQAFDVIIVDLDPAPGAAALEQDLSRRRPRKRAPSLEVFVRKLALLAAEGGATVLLVTDATIARPAPLPVALRLELARTENAISVRIGKDRHGRIGFAKTVPINSKPGLELAG
jgi:hypothetical protein